MNEDSLHLDMVAEARDVQWSPEVFLGPGVIKLIAPAKMNLFLNVGDMVDTPRGPRHELTSVFHSLALHDFLYMNCQPITVDQIDKDLADNEGIAGPADNVRVLIDMTERDDLPNLNVPVEENLVYKAIDTFARLHSIDRPLKVGVRIEKHIPVQAGLGGGSSDAAAVVLGLTTLGVHGNSSVTAEEVCAQVGSDVSFFLKGGCALYEGTGEQFVHSLAPMKTTLVVIKPPQGVSTAKAYSVFDQDPVRAPEGLLHLATETTRAEQVPLFNSLGPAAETLVPEISHAISWANSQLGTQQVLVCGSGSAIGVLMDDFNSAMAVVAGAQRQGWWARATAFSSLHGAVMPNK